MPARSAYDWALVRVVPRVERLEFVNAGAIVHCRDRRYLGAAVELSPDRLRALWPAVDIEEVERHLASLVDVAAGREGAGPIARLPMTERFHWLVAPRSTVVQPSPVHVGLCEAPEAALADLMERFVRLPPPQKFLRPPHLR